MFAGSLMSEENVSQILKLTANSVSCEKPNNLMLGIELVTVLTTQTKLWSLSEAQNLVENLFYQTCHTRILKIDIQQSKYSIYFAILDNGLYAVYSDIWESMADIWEDMADIWENMVLIWEKMANLFIASDIWILTSGKIMANCPKNKKLYQSKESTNTISPILDPWELKAKETKKRHLKLQHK
jgi:hypothetical protein